MVQKFAQKTIKTPEIIFDESAETIEIKGRSYPEDLNGFWQPQVERLNEVIQRLRAPKVKFELSYHNSGSTRIIMNFIREWEKLAGNGIKVSVDWLFDPEDEQTEEQGIDYSEFCKEVNFNLVAIH